MGMSGSEDEGHEVRVKVHDRRKLREDDGAQDAPGPKDASLIPEVTEPAPEEDPLLKAQAEAASYLDDLQRLKAEFDNFRKRVLKEQTAIVESAAGGLVARLLLVLDNFELAVAAAEETREFDKMLKGVEMVFGELKEVMKAEGLETIVAKGHEFDPTMHEAALEVPGDDSGRTVVSEILRPGYLFKGRVLRPAMVKVTQKAKE